MRKTHLSIYIVFLITATLILVNRYTAFYINDYRVHFILLFLASASFVIIVGHFFKKLRSNKSIIITFAVVGILCFLKAFFTWAGDWKTQTVVFVNKENPKITIESQLRADKFSFGYKGRIVTVEHLAPYMDWTTDADTMRMDKALWQRVDLYKNEMELSE